jgi:hypothetical protein
MCRTAKEKALSAWQAQWRTEKDRNAHRENLYSVANRFEPSLRPQEQFRSIIQRRLYGLVLQCRTGHAFMGEYYQRFVPLESVACPCGAAYQSRKHILLECSKYEAYHHLLYWHDQLMTVNGLFGTREGIIALSKFIAVSGAFTKSGDTKITQSGDAIYIVRRNNSNGSHHRINRGERQRRRGVREEGGERIH